MYDSPPECVESRSRANKRARADFIFPLSKRGPDHSEVPWRLKLRVSYIHIRRLASGFGKKHAPVAIMRNSFEAEKKRPDGMWEGCSPPTEHANGHAQTS
ncbi:hypothetical protein MCOR25_005935 [Pyricularia grisea]|nr:hypothetical protein MCOR25_005935 [Pyricularia grisea]